MCFCGKSAPGHSLPGWSPAQGTKDLGTLLLGPVKLPGDPCLLQVFPRIGAAPRVCLGMGREVPCPSCWALFPSGIPQRGGFSDIQSIPR